MGARLEDGHPDASWGGTSPQPVLTGGPPAVTCAPTVLAGRDSLFGRRRLGGKPDDRLMRPVRPRRGLFNGVSPFYPLFRRRPCFAAYAISLLMITNRTAMSELLAGELGG